MKGVHVKSVDLSRATSVPSPEPTRGRGKIPGAVLLLTISFLAGTLAFAQALPNPFDIGLGVRAMGFGGAYTALADGTEALLVNPAGLGWTRAIRGDSTLASVLGLYSVTWLAGAFPNFGGGLAYSGVGDITDPGGNPLAFSHLALTVGVGLDLALFRVFPFPAAGGLALKYHRMQIADQAGSGFALDIGVLGRAPTPLGEARFGVTLRDLGFGPTVGTEPDAWSLDFTVGAALLTPMGFSASLDLGSEYTALGLGWAIFGLAEIRGGVRFQGGFTLWALGLGVRWGMFALDYALLTHPVLSASHRFGFGVRF